MNWSTFILLSLVLSIPYGIGHWMVFQEKKKGTLIPTGALTSKYGLFLAFLLKGICYLIIIWYGFKIGWSVLIIVPLIWIISGIIARRIERILYAKNRLDNFEYHAQRHIEKFGEDKAPVLWEEVVPKWWTSIMSSKWKEEYIKRVGKYIKSSDTTSLLFDRDKFNSYM